MGLGWLITAVLVAARLSSALMVMPALSTKGIPVLTRLLCSLALTAVVAPVVPMAANPTSLSALSLGIAGEVIVGVVIGGVVRMVFGGLALAGEIMGSQTGHAAALQFDPTLQLSQGPIGKLSTFLAAAIFLGANLHLYMLVAIADSFSALPPGAASTPLRAAGVWMPLAGVVLLAGLQMAAPILALVFLVNTLVAVITRLSPSMNVFFSLGLILTMGAGQGVYFISLPHLLERQLEMIRDSLNLIPEVLRLAGGG